MRFKLAAFALIVSASIARAGDCVPVSKVKADAGAAFAGAVMAEMGGTEAASFIASLNAMPPATAIAGDYLLAITVPGKAVIIVTFANGCAGATTAIPERIFHKLLQTL